VPFERRAVISVDIRGTRVSTQAVVQRVRSFLDEELWAEEHTSRWVGRAVGLLQFAMLTAQGFVRDRLLLHASALTYFTVISLIPIFAIVIGIAAAIGVESDFAAGAVAKLAAGAPGAQQFILEQIGSADLRAMGGIGAAIVFVVTVLGISNIEGAFNTIWGVKKPRSLGRRFPDYLAILVVIPLLATGLSVATGLKSPWLLEHLFAYEAFSSVYEIGLKQLPWLTLSGAFALMFWFLPNTTVKFSSAALGGAVSGMLVLMAQNAYLSYSVGMAKANALYGAFAQLPLLFGWIYVFWAIVLFGAELAFAHQNLASYRRELRDSAAAPAEREGIALRIAIQVAQTFRDACPAETTDRLAIELDAPVRVVRDVLAQLEAAGILSRRGGSSDEDGFQLGQPAERIRVIDILAALRGVRDPGAGDGTAGVVGRLLKDLDRATVSGGGARTLAELLAEASDHSENLVLALASAERASLDPPSTGG
jgi:membrane protein